MLAGVVKRQLLTRGPAVGKTTRGRALAVERDRAAYIDVDDIRQLIVAELARIIHRPMRPEMRVKSPYSWSGQVTQWATRSRIDEHQCPVNNPG